MLGLTCKVSESSSRPLASIATGLPPHLSIGLCPFRCLHFVSANQSSSYKDLQALGSSEASIRAGVLVIAFHNLITMKKNSFFFLFSLLR